MDFTLTSSPPLREYVQDLLSYSPLFESSLIFARKRRCYEALPLLGTLEELASDTLKPSLPESDLARVPVSLPMPSFASVPVPKQGTTVPTPPPVRNPARLETPRSQYTSSSPMYHPALKDQALIAALLSLHNKKTQKQLPKGPEHFEPGFSSPAIPEIQTEIKNTNSLKKSQGIPILRAQKSKALP